MSNRTHSAEDGWPIGVMKKCPVCGSVFWVRDHKWGYTLSGIGMTKKRYFAGGAVSASGRSSGRSRRRKD